MSVRPVVSRFSIPAPSTIPAADGPVFISRLHGDAIETEEDRSVGMVRTEGVVFPVQFAPRTCV